MAACWNLFSSSYFASKNRHKQPCVNIWFEKKTISLYGLQRTAVQICECLSNTLSLRKVRTAESEKFSICCCFPLQRHKESQDCVFQRIRLDVRSHHVGGAAHSESPGPSDALQRLLGPLVKRQRRSEEVNPSDPLRSESHPSHPVKDHKDLDVGQPEQDQAGAVSKETISSCDDPLRVLQPNGPVSPVKTNIADQAQQD